MWNDSNTLVSMGESDFSKDVLKYFWNLHSGNNVFLTKKLQKYRSKDHYISKVIKNYYTIIFFLYSKSLIYSGMWFLMLSQSRTKLEYNQHHLAVNITVWDSVMSVHKPK